RRSYSGRDHRSSREAAGTTSHRCRARRFYGSTTRRIDWTPVAGRGLRGSLGSRSAFGSDDGGRGPKDRSVRERLAARRGSCRVSLEAETQKSVPATNGLGFCFARDEGQATALAGHDVAALRKACGDGSGDNETRCVSHVSSYLYNAAHTKQRGRESCA